MTELRFEGRVAIVTGAGRGLGRAYALALARRGAQVVVNDTGVGPGGQHETGAREPADSCVAEIRLAGGTAVANYDSVAEASGAGAIVAQALRDFGRIDVLINNAGVGLDKPFVETTPADFQRVLAVHFMGTVFMCGAAWPALTAAGSGRVVNTTSSAVFGFAGCSAYGAAKGAVLAFTRTLALEGSAAGIGVNAVAPAAATRMTAGVAMDEGMRAWLERSLPPAAVAPVVLFLAHPSCQLRGEILSAAGGAARRYLLGETAGYRSDALTPEAVAENISRIQDPSTFCAFSDTNEATARAQSLR
jgi:NAD(P)-dependent dehydrogenase (short-subunit alcohol dehydrogenase family)